MTSLFTFPDTVRNGQDGTERHCYGQTSFGEGGATVAVQGNGTQDDDCVVLALGGCIMNLPKGTNAEVILLAGGDDTNAKFALVVGPRNKQYQSAEGEVWTQHPLDPNQRMGYSTNGVRIVGTKSGTIAVGDNGEIEIDKDGGKVYMRGQWYFENPPISGTKQFNP